MWWKFPIMRPWRILFTKPPKWNNNSREEVPTGSHPPHVKERVISTIP